jgi:hypothetical protein
MFVAMTATSPQMTAPEYHQFPRVHIVTAKANSPAGNKTATANATGDNPIVPYVSRTADPAFRNTASVIHPVRGVGYLLDLGSGAE